MADASLCVGNIIKYRFALKRAQATNRFFSTADWTLSELGKSDKLPTIRFDRIPGTEYLHILHDPIGFWPSDHTGSDNRLLSDSSAESHRISADWVDFWSDSDNPFSTGSCYRNRSKLKRIRSDLTPWFWHGSGTDSADSAGLGNSATSLCLSVRNAPNTLSSVNVLDKTQNPNDLKTWPSGNRGRGIRIRCPKWDIN